MIFVSSLQKKSTEDAEAVKVLTIIGLVYLPTTFVAVRSPLLRETRLGLTTFRTSFLLSSCKQMITGLCGLLPTPGYLRSLLCL